MVALKPRTDAPTPPEFKKTWSARLPLALIDRMHEYSYVSRIPLQEVVEQALIQYLDREYPVPDEPLRPPLPPKAKPAPPEAKLPPPPPPVPAAPEDPATAALRADVADLRALIVTIIKEKKEKL
jgi:hypothetical protein